MAKKGDDPEGCQKGVGSDIIFAPRRAARRALPSPLGPTATRLRPLSLRLSEACLLPKPGWAPSAGEGRARSRRRSTSS